MTGALHLGRAILGTGLALGVGFGVVGCGTDPPKAWSVDPPVVTALRAPTHLQACADSTTDDDFLVDTIARGLRVPWATAFADDGTLFVSERPGRISVLRPGSGVVEPWAEVPVFEGGEAGLLGLALGSGRDGTPSVYVAGTFPRFGVLRRALRRLPFLGDESHTLVTRILRFRDEGGVGVLDGVVFGDIPGQVLHVGAEVAFGPDGMLYVTHGDGVEPHAAQDPGDWRGKILRISPDGTVPPDNPDPASPVYARGLRNPQGLAWHPEDRRLWVSDHGPSGMEHEGGWADHDELNLVGAGDNLGWPWARGLQSVEGSQEPVHDWTPAVAPSDLTFGAAVDGGHELWVTHLRRQAVSRLVVEGDSVICEDFLFLGDFGRLRSAQWHGGALFVTTSNHDHQIQPRIDDDLVLRIRRRGPEAP